MSVSWDFYSKRRRVSLQRFMVNNCLNSYSEMTDYLAKLGIVPPTQEYFDKTYVVRHCVDCVNKELVFTETEESETVDAILNQIADVAHEDDIMTTIQNKDIKRIGSNRKKSKIIDQPDSRVDIDVDNSNDQTDSVNT